MGHHNEIMIRIVFFFSHLYLIVAHTIPKIHKYDVDKKVQIFTKYCKKEIDLERLRI